MTRIADENEDTGARRARGRAMIDRRHPPAHALVLVPVLGRDRKIVKGGETRVGRRLLHSPQDRLQEARGLAEAIDLAVVDARLVAVADPRPSTLLGSGKVIEIAALVEAEKVELVIVDHTLSPVQQRNLEKAWNAKVLDRTGLILEIFGRRARTREGSLQVELAHLTYQKSRLVRSWTHLERQRGGAGFLGGPGETQLELDRRMIDDRIESLNADLAAVVRTRELHRKGRKRVPYPVAAIVGYTNAGKSTLFNRITGAAVLAKDQVFATLDPTMREVKLESGRRIIISDTVGFISDLPTALVAAFRATLEEVVAADLILHVQDISHPEHEAQRIDVERVLTDLGVTVSGPDAHLFEVWNKIDRLDAEAREEIERSSRRNERSPILVSAISGVGINRLLSRVDGHFALSDDLLSLTVPATQGALIHWLHENVEVLDRHIETNGALAFKLRMDKTKRARLIGQLKRAGLPLPDKQL